MILDIYPTLGMKKAFAVICLFCVLIIGECSLAMSQGYLDDSTKPVLGINHWRFKPVSQPDILGQHYFSEQWANERLSPGQRRWMLAGLGNIIAIIQRAKGLSKYQIGSPGTWSDETGSFGVFGVVVGTENEMNVSVPTIRKELQLGNPMILQGSSNVLGDNHYMLAVALDADDQIIAIDPFTASFVLIETRYWHVKHDEHNISFRVKKMKRVQM